MRQAVTRGVTEIAVEYSTVAEITQRERRVQLRQTGVLATASPCRAVAILESAVAMSAFCLSARPKISPIDICLTP